MEASAAATAELYRPAATPADAPCTQQDEAVDTPTSASVPALITRALAALIVWVAAPSVAVAGLTYAISRLTAPDYARDLVAGRTYGHAWQAWGSMALTLVVGFGATTLLALLVRRYAKPIHVGHLGGMACTMCIAIAMALSSSPILPSAGISAHEYPQLLVSHAAVVIPLHNRADALRLAGLVHSLPVGSCRLSSGVLYIHGARGADRLPQRMQVCRKAHSVRIRRV